MFDRFHVMQQYSKIIDQVRRAEFKRAAKADRPLLAGSRYLLLKNPDNLSDRQTVRLDDLLAANSPLNAVYALKEQLEQLWHASASVVHMDQHLDQWCDLAHATGLAPMRRFVAMLQRHRTSICNYPSIPSPPHVSRVVTSPSAHPKTRPWIARYRLFQTDTV